jgi:hypothetical protein
MSDFQKFLSPHLQVRNDNEGRKISLPPMENIRHKLCPVRSDNESIKAEKLPLPSYGKHHTSSGKKNK